MTCNIYETEGDAHLVESLLKAYLKYRGLKATINCYQHATHSQEFKTSGISLTPTLIIDSETVISGENLTPTTILKKIYATVEGEPLGDTSSACGSCRVSKANGGTCGSTTGMCDSYQLNDE